MSCIAGKYGDASEVKVRVYSPPTNEAYALYGDLEKVSTQLHSTSESQQDGDVFLQAIKTPKDAIKVLAHP